MADYDAKVRVKADVDNSDLSKLQKDFDKLEEKLASLHRKGEKLEALGVDKQSRQWKSLIYDIAQAEVALGEVEDRIQEVNAINMDGTESAFSRIRNASKSCFKSIQDGTKKSNGLLSTLKSRLKGIALSLLVFNWITKGFNAMVSAMKEGFQNLAQYSDEYNESMSALKSQMAQLKNGLAAAFEPIVNMAIPYLTQLITWLNTAADAVGQFLAVLQGKSTYTRAKKQVVDYAKSLDTASKSAKGALASFDQLNVLNKENGAVSSGLSGADAFEEATVNPEIYEMLEKVKKLLEIIKPLAVGIGIALLAWKIADFLTDLGKVAVNLKSAYGIILFIAGVVLSVYEYLDMWNNGVDWEGILGYISGVAMAAAGLYLICGPMAAGIVLIAAGVAGLILAFKDMTTNGVNAQNMFLAVVSAVGLVLGVFLIFGGTAAMVVAAILGVVGSIAAMIAWAGNGEEALERIKTTFAKLGSFVKNVFAGDWDAAFKDIVDVAKGAVNMVIIIVESLINCIVKGFNNLFGKLNEFSIDIPDWVPIIGGGSIKTIPEVSWPRLADGAVIQGGQPFAAILGDQRFGQTNIETPLATMVEAFKQAQAESGSTGGGEYTFIAQLDGKTLFRETVKQNQMQYKATGKNAFA